jgi:hypothetical protein
MTIFNFNPESDLQDWLVVDDVVMGGRSDGRFYLNEEGHGVFTGEVSLENNGGFSSVRHRFTPKKAEGFTKAVIRLRGDGKRYQFRVKSDSYDRHSYVSYFQTTGEWQVVEIPLSEMYPTFRGRTLNMPNYPGLRLSEVAFLIANKRAEPFRLEIDFIELR